MMGVSRTEEQWGQANEGMLMLHRTRPQDEHRGVYVDKLWFRAGGPSQMSRYCSEYLSIRTLAETTTLWIVFLARCTANSLRQRL